MQNHREVIFLLVRAICFALSEAVIYLLARYAYK